MPLWLTAWFAKMWAKCSQYVIAAGSILAAIAGIFLYGRFKGKSAADAKHAEQDAKRIEAETKIVEKIDQAHESTREQVEEKIEKIPAPTTDPNETVRVGDAPKDSAAGKLRGW